MPYALTVTACLLFMVGLMALAGAKHIDLRIVLFELATAWFAFLGLQAIHKKQNDDGPPPHEAARSVIPELQMAWLLR